jgi:hypothetical protein
MARQLSLGDGSGLTPSRFTEQRAPNVVGGSVDPDTGNLLPATRQDAAKAPPPEIDAPAEPTTRLADFSAPKSDFGDALENAALGAGAKVLGDAAGKALGSAFGSGGSKSSSNPLDRSPGEIAGSSGSTSSGGSVSENAGNPFDSTNPLGSPSSASPTGGFSASPYIPGYGGPGDGGGLSFSTGTVICTELHRQGYLTDAQIEADRNIGASMRLFHPHVYRGYIAWAPYVVAGMQRSKRFSRFIAFIARPWATHLAYAAGDPSSRPTFHGFMVLSAGFAVCGLIGGCAALRDRFAPCFRFI